MNGVYNMNFSAGNARELIDGRFLEHEKLVHRVMGRQKADEGPGRRGRTYEDDPSFRKQDYVLRSMAVPQPMPSIGRLKS